MVAAFAVAMAGVRASTTVHRNLLHSVLRLPFTTFQTIPIGRFINRFSSDISKVDLAVPFACRSAVNIVIATVFAIAIVCQNLPWVVLTVAVLAVPYIFFQVCCAQAENLKIYS